MHFFYSGYYRRFNSTGGSYNIAKVVSCVASDLLKLKNEKTNI